MYRKAFAISSFLMVLMLGAIVMSNYNREWKPYQRAYFYELDARAQAQQPQRQDMSLLDQLTAWGAHAAKVAETETKLSMVKVVTDPGRSADLCMTCHINVGVGGFTEQPLVDLISVHPEYIVQNYPFDQVGCTACHGGQPLALSVEKAHEGLADTVESFFLLKVAELNAPNWIVRQKAIERIRWMAKDDFGYSQDASDEERQAAIDRVLDWWELHKQTFFAEGFGERTSPFKTHNPIKETVEADPRLSPTGQVLEYVNNNSCIGCHTTLYGGRLDEARAENNAESIAVIQKQLDHIRLWANIDLSDITLSDEAFANVAQQYTCQACHGPGEEYIKLMQKGYALLMQGKSIESSDVLKHASEIGRGNARHSLSDPKVWELLQALAARSAGTSAAETQPAAPTSEPAKEAPEQTPAPEGSQTPPPSETPPAEEASTNDVQIARGQQLAGQCLGCHSVDGSAALVGPTWQGLYGKTETLNDGTTAAVDDAYLHESIREPGAKIVQGYANIMPPYAGLSDEDLAALIAYIKSLAP